MGEDVVEMSQTISIDDTLTPTQDDNEGGELPEDIVESVDITSIQHTSRGSNHQRINADYIQRKRKRIKHLPAVTLTAVRSTGNPNHHNTRVLLQYSDTMGVSVFVAFYAVKGELIGDQYSARYPVGVKSLTDEHRRDKDCIIKYDNDLYMIGDHTEPKNSLGIA